MIDFELMPKEEISAEVKKLSLTLKTPLYKDTLLYDFVEEKELKQRNIKKYQQ